MSGSAIPYDTLAPSPRGATLLVQAATSGRRWRQGLKMLEDATTIRRRMLPAFEKAERETDRRSGRRC